MAQQEVKAVTREQLLQEIGKLQATRTDMRAKERSVQARYQYLNMMPTIPSNGDIQSNLSKILPKHLIPKNVGEYKQILKMFWYNIEFPTSIMTNPTLNSSYKQLGTFQVSQGWAFLLTQISRTWKTTVGYNAPLQFKMQDNQSTRVFNNIPIPVSMIGSAGKPFKFETPMLFMPNAAVTLELTSWSPINLALIGDCYQEFAFGGYRLNPDDAKYITENILL